MFLFVALWLPRLAVAEAPPSPRRHVTDRAQVLDPETALSLSSRLAAYEQATGHQVVVWVDQSTGTQPIEQFAVEAFEAWKVGRKGEDDGVALFVFINDRKARIEVGYGLEDRLTDLQAAKIIRDIIVPNMRADQPEAAVVGATEAIVDVIEGKSGALEGATSIRGPPSGGAPELKPVHIVLMVVFGVGFLILLATNPRLALWLLWVVVARGGGHGGGGGAGGGFRGGGGRSGGGGASGGW